MSAFLRANKTRRVRSLTNGSSSSSSSEENKHTGGVPITNPSEDGSPQNPKVRFSAITQEIGRMSISSSVASGGSARDPIQSSPFRIGNANDDVFSASPRTPVKREHAGPAKSPFLDAPASEERRLTRAVTTGTTALVLGAAGDRTSRHHIGGVDVQGIYPPSACVFVANLPESKEDRALEAAVTREFSRYGTVFVKIRRDGNHMPFAFCQFTNDNDANVAMEQGRGTVILGRPCRTEMVKANRTFVIYRRDGGEVTPGVARAILEPYGELSRCELLNSNLQEAMKLPQAVLVEFATFDPKRDLNSAVREHDEFRIDAFDVKKKNLVTRVDADEDFLRKYDVDRRSVFVGNLPFDAEKEEVIELFSEVGDVANLDIIKRTNNGQIVRAFGFLEFARADVPDRAIERFNHHFHRGHTLKVERKVFKHANTPRRVKSQAFSIKSSTTPRTPRVAAPPQTDRPSVKRETLAPAPAQHGFPHPGAAGDSIAPPFFAPIPASGPNGGPVLGASGLPVTPSATPYAAAAAAAAALNPYTYMGGYWQGMSSYQDPVTGYTYYTYTPPAGSSSAVPGTETPTRGRSREQKPHHDA